MALVPFSFPLTGGLDRRVAPLKADKATFYTMANMRQTNTVRGIIEQTPRFYAFGTRAQGTYWDGAASATEPTSSCLLYWNDVQGFSMSQYCANIATVGSLAGAQMLVLNQTVAPTSSGVTKGCLITVITPGSVTVTLGKTYDVEIDAATTFRWRVNGGGWTAGVTIDATNGNLIDSNTIRLWWLTGTGFTIGDTWSWMRTDTYGDDYFTNALKILQVGTRFFFVGASNRIYVMEAIGTGLRYIRTVGYQPIYGKNIIEYEDHLWVIGVMTAAGGDTSNISCSDLSNLDNFIATDVNEADTFALQLSRYPASTTRLIPYAACVILGRLYVATTAGIFYTDYAGLPIPFSFKKLIEFDSISTGEIFMLHSNNTIYLATTTNLFTYSSGSLQFVLNFNNYGVSGNPRGLYYLEATGELFIAFSTTLLVLQTRYGTFYTRSVDFSALGNTALSFNTSGTLHLGTSGRVAYKEDATCVQTPVFDGTAGTAFATPTLITQLIGDKLSVVKECQPVYVGMTVGTSGTNYSHSANLQVVLSYYLEPTGKFSTSAVATGTLLSTAVDGLISTLRASYRAMALQITLNGLSTGKPPAIFTLQSLETEVYSTDTRR